MRGSNFMKIGSLQLSVNAIVVLVLAITMLGLGLAFTKGKFSELSQSIEVPEPDYPATVDEPIVLAVNKITMKQGRTNAFTANFYNNLGSSYFQPCLECQGDVTTKENSLINPIHVGSGEYETFKILLLNVAEAGDLAFTADVASNVCTIYFKDLGGAAPQVDCVDNDVDYVSSKQIVLDVR